MDRSVTCYPTPYKAKARLLCEAFAAGVIACGERAHVCTGEIPRALEPGAAVFYGVTPATVHLFDQARREERDWIYIDNAYFDATRERYFRVTKNALQHSGMGESDGERFAALEDVPVKPWRGRRGDNGGHVLLCPQSDEFMRVCAGYRGDWTADTLKRLRAITQRELRVRPWDPDKRAGYRELRETLDEIWAVVTYSSASAITALLEGVPAFVTAQDCIARPVRSGELIHIDLPHPPKQLAKWARVVADHQFTLDELRAGLAWRALNEPRAMNHGSHDGLG